MRDLQATNSSPVSGIDAEAFVHWVNVIILAQYHNPSILNQDFLAKNVVPRSWDVVEAISTPAAAQVVYANGLRFVADQSRLEVRRDVNNYMQPTYDIFAIASKYVKTLPHVPYKSVGLNWQISLECADPNVWLLQRFYRSSVYRDNAPDVLGCGVQLRYAGPSSVCNLKLDAGNVTRPGKPQTDAILVNANFHHDVNTYRKIMSVLTQWPKAQEFINELITILLRRPE